jgi:hypothetical protein
VSFGIVVPLHCSRIDTHWRLANEFEISWRARKTVVSFAQNHDLALRIGVDDPGSIGDICWAGRHRAGYFGLCGTLGSALGRDVSRHSIDEYHCRDQYQKK